MSSKTEDWNGNGWDDHESFSLEVGQRMTFRAKLQWLEDASELVRRLSQQRRWIDKDGVVHEPAAGYTGDGSANKH